MRRADEGTVLRKLSVGGLLLFDDGAGSVLLDRLDSGFGGLFRLVALAARGYGLSIRCDQPPAELALRVLVNLELVCPVTTS